MKSIESNGRTVREAIEDGLKKLNKSLGEVEVKILSQGGLLRKAKVLITVSGTDDLEELNIDYLGPKKQRSEEELLEREKRYQAYSENIKIPDDAEMNRPISKPKKEFDKKNDRNKSDKNRNEGRNDRIRNESRGEKIDRNNDRQKTNRGETRPFERKHKEEVFSALTDEVSQKAQDFLSKLLEKMGIEHSLNKTISDNQLTLEIVCDSGAAIGYRGETLSSLEYLTALSISHASERYKIAVDCNGYKEKREQSLIALAERMASKALKTGRKVVLEPMTSSSRKVIHSVLSENDKLITRSEGNEPNRRIVILPKRQKPISSRNKNDQKSSENNE